jgi:hypothetical protein
VDARLVRERVRADDGLVRRHDDPVTVLTRRLDAHELRRVDARAKVELGRACRERHHDLFERRVAGALADAVDRHLGLARAGEDSRRACSPSRGRGRRGSAPRG